MVNTLELRNLETYSPEIQTFLREIEKSFLQVLNNCVPADQLPVNLPITQLDDTNSSRYTYDCHYHTWRRNLDIEAFELNYLEIQPIVVPASHVAYENIGWDEQGEVIPGISMTVVRRIPTRNLTYNAATGATVDVTGFTFDFQKMPAAIKDLRAGDMVLHRGKPMYVQSIEEDGIHCIDILNSEAKVIVPVTNMFGFNFVTKVVSLMNFNAAQPSAENPFGNLMPFMMMSSVMGDDSDNDFSKMMMMGGSNPFTPQDK